MTKREYFRKNGYTRLSIYLLLLTAALVFFGLFDGVRYWWINPAITGAAVVVIHIAGTRAYKQYAKQLDKQATFSIFAKTKEQ